MFKRALLCLLYLLASPQVLALGSASVVFEGPAQTAYTAPASYTVSVSAESLGYAITGFSLRENGVVIASGGKFSSGVGTLAAPRSGLPAGTYTYTATATTSDGRSSSRTLTITVSAPIPPTVTLGTVAGGTVAPATLGLSASASDSDGTVSRVEFYANGQVVGTSYAAPYAMSWVNVGAGTYSITAKAYDNSGLSATSAATSVTVSPAPVPPTVSIGAVTGGTIAPATLGLSATASDSDGTVSKVEFYANGQLVGTDAAAPYAASWANVGAGTYSVTAKAYDNSGLTTTSAATSVTVSPSRITGNIDGIADVSGTPNLRGWACSTGLNQSIDVHLYVGGAAGAGTGLLAATANLASEPGVASACQASGANYRFSIPLTLAMRQQYNGQKLYVHGISPVGQPNDLIGQSGVYAMPAPPSAPIVALGAVTGGTVAPATLGLSATASDSDGTIAKVEFYANGQLVGTDTTAPYEMSWANVGAGTYSITAKAHDNIGLTATSTATSVTVSAPPASPTSVTRYYVYDQYQQLCKVVEPETRATVMDYDAAGNLQWSAAGLELLGIGAGQCDTIAGRDSGRKVTRYYDARNRLKSLTFPDGVGNQSWTYTPDGLLDTVTTYNSANNGTPVVNTYRYNNRRLLTEEHSIQAGWYDWPTRYAYDALGSQAGYTTPDQLQVTYAPNALGQPTEVRTAWGLHASGISYYPNGAVRQFTYGNGIVHAMTQNARQLPQRVTSSGGVLDFDYGFDPNGNVDHIYDFARGSNYSRWMTYDGLDRLKSAGSAMFGGDHWHRFTYDALDNITSWTLAGVKDYASYYYEPTTHRLTNIRNSAGAGVVGLDYDAQGNLSNKNGQGYVFDYGNRLREVSGKEGYRYDGQGRRVLAWSPSTGGILSAYGQDGKLYFTQDQRRTLNIPNIYLAGSLLATIEWNYSTNTGQVKYQHTDALGSPVAVTDATGQVIERTDYEPYGAAINKPAYQGIGYTGHVMDGATGLTYMQQRYYDPSVGRFLSVDPVTADSATGGNFNRYWYANNNPYKFTDPDGRFVLQAGGIIGGAAVGVLVTAGGDLIRGELSSGGTYLGAAAGGAVAGAVLTTTGNPVLAGAAGGAASSAIQQKVDIGKVNAVDVGTAAVVGGVVGGVVPGAKVPGITSGRNSFAAVAKSAQTKLANGTISRVSATTVGKASVAAGVDGAAGAAVSDAGTRGVTAARDAVGSAMQNVRLPSVTVPRVPNCVGKPCAGN